MIDTKDKIITAYEQLDRSLSFRQSDVPIESNRFEGLRRLAQNNIRI